MIPLRDSVRPRRFPVANSLIIAANLLVWSYMVFGLDRQAGLKFVFTYGLVPQRVVQLATVFGEAGNPRFLEALVVPFLTAMFLHGSWFHVLGNMWFLWVFGDNVEDSMGSFRYLAFYLLAGTVGSVAHVAASPLSPVPVIGASGAVAGVLGAYLVRFPRHRVVALVPLGFFLTVAELPALVFLLLWFLIQVANGLALAGGVVQEVAWWAHIGGFVAGMLLVSSFARRRSRHW